MPAAVSLVTDDELYDLAADFRARTPFVYESAENAGAGQGGVHDAIDGTRRGVRALRGVLEGSFAIARACPAKQAARQLETDPRQVSAVPDRTSASSK